MIIVTIFCFLLLTDTDRVFGHFFRKTEVFDKFYVLKTLIFLSKKVIFWKHHVLQCKMVILFHIDNFPVYNRKNHRFIKSLWVFSLLLSIKWSQRHDQDIMLFDSYVFLSAQNLRFIDFIFPIFSKPQECITLTFYFRNSFSRWNEENGKFLPRKLIFSSRHFQQKKTENTRF